MLAAESEVGDTKRERQMMPEQEVASAFLKLF